LQSRLRLATADCLAQKFPLFVLVGPAALDELASTVAALDGTLSDEEVRWLRG
jgi:aryl-alcohol dehydrogenase-like predicted oxidoreductase